MRCFIVPSPVPLRLVCPPPPSHTRPSFLVSAPHSATLALSPPLDPSPRMAEGNGMQCDGQRMVPACSVAHLRSSSWRKAEASLRPSLLAKLAIHISQHHFLDALSGQMLHVRITYESTSGEELHESRGEEGKWALDQQNWQTKEESCTSCRGGSGWLPEFNWCGAHDHRTDLVSKGADSLDCLFVCLILLRESVHQPRTNYTLHTTTENPNGFHSSQIGPLRSHVPRMVSQVTTCAIL